MDSFFSLFDPSDGNQNKHNNKKRHKIEPDNIKKKSESSKGRRRGRKSNGKNETLPEESSFLCEPDLSTELLVKDVSYIENFIEINKRDDVNNKPKRRNSGRKNRRKKNKISPAKDLLPNIATNQEFNEESRNLSNQIAKPKICDENVGKNVNDLTKVDEDYKKNKRKASVDSFDSDDHVKSFKDRAVYNVIEKLEKVSLKDDMYLAGDFDTEELENDFFYSSDDLEDYVDDSTSEPEDSGDEVFGGCASPHQVPETLCKTRSKIKNRKSVRRKNKNLLRDIADAEENLSKNMDDIENNLYKVESDGEEQNDCVCVDKIHLEDPNDPRGCIFFQASVNVLRHSTAIYPGFQCTVHVGNVRQTAIIEGIMSRNNLLRAGEAASVMFRFVRCPEYLVRGRQLLFTAGLGTGGIGRITQIFPYVP